MVKVKNLTNSPIEMKLSGGKKGRLKARGEDEFDIDAKMLPYYKNCGFLEVSETSKKADKTEQKAESSDKPEVRHVGAGRYNVFLNDEKLSDEPMSKDEAEELANADH